MPNALLEGMATAPGEQILSLARTTGISLAHAISLQQACLSPHRCVEDPVARCPQRDTKETLRRAAQAYPQPRPRALTHANARRPERPIRACCPSTTSEPCATAHPRAPPGCRVIHVGYNPADCRGGSRRAGLKRTPRQLRRRRVVLARAVVV